MAEQRIQVKIRPDGTIHAETIGMYGPQCLDYLKALEQLLAARITHTEKKPEFAQTLPEGEQVTPPATEQVITDD